MSLQRLLQLLTPFDDLQPDILHLPRESFLLLSHDPFHTMHFTEAAGHFFDVLHQLPSKVLAHLADISALMRMVTFSEAHHAQDALAVGAVKVCWLSGVELAEVRTKELGNVPFHGYSALEYLVLFAQPLSLVLLTTPVTQILATFDAVHGRLRSHVLLNH